MKIEVGKFYRTRDGRKARIYALDGSVSFFIHGAIKTNGGWIMNTWTSIGLVLPNCENEDDLISEWKEPLDFDPSCLPAWAEWVAMNECGEWHWFQKEPVVTIDEEEQGIWMPIPRGLRGGIHHAYYPKDYAGYWKDSLHKVSDLKTHQS